MASDKEMSKPLMTHPHTANGPDGGAPNVVVRASASVDGLLSPDALRRRTNVGHPTSTCGMCCPDLFSCCLSCMVPCVWAGGLMQITEQNAGVVLYQGRLRYVVEEPGLYCANPCFRSMNIVSLKRHTMELTGHKISDRTGSPVVLSAVVAFSVQDPIRASLDVDDYRSFVRNQAISVMKSVASRYPYDAPDHEPSLKTETEHVTEAMANELQEAVTVVGVSIDSFRLADCSYAREIAAGMLVRQQAAALVDARRTVVEGAVSIARGAIEELESDPAFRFDQAAKSRLVSNLLVTVASDAKVTPVVSIDP